MLFARFYTKIPYMYKMHLMGSKNRLVEVLSPVAVLQETPFVLVIES